MTSPTNSTGIRGASTAKPKSALVPARASTSGRVTAPRRQAYAPRTLPARSQALAKSDAEAASPERRYAPISAGAEGEER